MSIKIVGFCKQLGCVRHFFLGIKTSLHWFLFVPLQSIVANKALNGRLWATCFSESFSETRRFLLVDFWRHKLSFFHPLFLNVILIFSFFAVISIVLSLITQYFASYSIASSQIPCQLLIWIFECIRGPRVKHLRNYFSNISWFLDVCCFVSLNCHIPASMVPMENILIIFNSKFF